MVGSDESHFNHSLIVRDKIPRQCPQTTTFEEKGELKQIRPEVSLLTSLTPYRLAKPALNCFLFCFFNFNTPPHGQPHAIFGDLAPFLQGGCCHARNRYRDLRKSPHKVVAHNKMLVYTIAFVFLLVAINVLCMPHLKPKRVVRRCPRYPVMFMTQQKNKTRIKQKSKTYNNNKQTKQDTGKFS